jgi:hypothetical protein
MSGFTDPVPPSHIRSFGLLYAGLIGVVAAAFWLAYHKGLDLVGLMAAGYGILLLVFTLGRSWAFWNHYTVLWWRDLVGDKWARVAFVVLGVGFLAVGAVDIHLGLDEVARCQQLLVAATNSHQRVAILYAHPGPARTGAQDPLGLHEKPLNCEGYRERGGL